MVSNENLYPFLKKISKKIIYLNIKNNTSRYEILLSLLNIFADTDFRSKLLSRRNN